MCRNWFKKEDIKPLIGDLVRVAMSINNYDGRANNLNGCNNDNEIMGKFLLSLYPTFKMRELKDYKVTRSRTKQELNFLVDQMLPGDVFFSFMDCCFAGSNTKGLTSLSRYHNLGHNAGKVVKRAFRSPDMKWISFSGSQDFQTSADAFIDNLFQGAFTYYARKAYTPGITYRKWGERTKNLLASSPFDQICVMEGPDYLLDRVAFADRTFMFQYSGHGTQLRDRNSDEPDGLDEALYLYDGALLDDDIFEILQRIPT